MITRKTRSVKAVFVASGFLLAAFAMPGLSLASIGELQISKSIAQNFEAHRFYSDFRYYALMDGDIPYAIVGLQKGYRIHDISWKKIDSNSAQLSHIEDLVQFYPVQGSDVYGAYILDSHNKRIGTLYSSLTAGVIVNKENKTISITTDNSRLGK